MMYFDIGERMEDFVKKYWVGVDQWWRIGVFIFVSNKNILGFKVIYKKL